MTYRNPSGFEHPFLGVPLDEATALAAYARFSADTNQKNLRNLPPLKTPPMRRSYSSTLDLSYRHLPVLEQTPSDLLVPPDLDVGSLLKQEQVSGAKSLTHSPALPALAGMSFVHKRHAETRLLAPHWLGGGAACGEGVIGGEGEGYFQNSSKKGIFFRFTCDDSVKILDETRENFMEIPFIIGQEFKSIDFIENKLLVQIAFPPATYEFNTNESYFKYDFIDVKAKLDSSWKELMSFYLKEFFDSMKYLCRSPFACSIIKSVNENLYVPIYMTMDVTTAAFKLMTEDIIYSPISGCVYRKEGELCRQTPALGLIHEIVHLQNYFTNKVAFNARIAKRDPVYTHMEERNVILNYENLIAKELGEPERFTHKVEFYKTKNATTTDVAE